MKRLLIFAGFFHPRIGGHEKHVYELSRRLVQRGYEVDIITCNTEKVLTYEALNGIRIYRLPSWNALKSAYPVPKPCLTSLKIMRRLLGKDYDVINTQTRFFITSFLGLTFAKLKRTPLVHTEHGTRHSVVDNKVVSLLSRAYDHTIGAAVVKSARITVGVSEAACEFLRHLGANNTFLIYNGIETSVFRKKHTGYRQKLGITNDTLLITFVGRLIYAKGVQDLIRAFAKIGDVVPKTKLLIVGDGPYRANLERLARQSGHDSDILFLGQKNQGEVIDILSATDIFVNPSYSEGLPTSVMEAASIGLPIIATDIGGTREIIVDHETGILAKTGDTGQLEEKLQELLFNMNLREKLGENARMFVEQKFHWDKITQDWVKLVEGIE
jgi:glycosyltransferase involved in cell wall biosynthesis